jgi:hypothetical protein
MKTKMIASLVLTLGLFCTLANAAPEPVYTVDVSSNQSFDNLPAYSALVVTLSTSGNSTQGAIRLRGASPTFGAGLPIPCTSAGTSCIGPFSAIYTPGENLRVSFSKEELCSKDPLVQGDLCSSTDTSNPELTAKIFVTFAATFIGHVAYDSGPVGFFPSMDEAPKNDSSWFELYNRF